MRGRAGPRRGAPPRRRARGAELSRVPEVSVVPDPPQTAMLHLLARRPFEALQEASLDVAEETRVWPGAFWSRTADPQVQRAELSVGEASFDVPLEEAR